MKFINLLKRFYLIYKIFVVRTHPVFILRFARFIFSRYLLKQMIPITAMVSLTYRCQCRCVHCSVEKRDVKSTMELTTSEVISFLDGLSRLGVLKIGFTGGEPLLRDDICELVAYAFRKGFSVSIDTNGVLLSAAMVSRLKSSGICNFNISIDRPDAVFHDRLRRNKGCFDNAIAGLKECVRLRVPCVISTYVTRWGRAKTRLNEIIIMGRQLKVTAVRVLFPIYSGQLSDKKQHLLSPTDKKDFFNTIVDPDFVYSESPLFDFISSRVECTARRKLSIYITPDGFVKPCYATSQSLGTVRDKSIGQVLKDSSYLDLGTALKIQCESLV